MMIPDAPCLCYTALSSVPEAPDALLPLLSEERRRIVSRRPPKSRTASACAELLLRYALRAHGYEPSLPVLWDGKPRFADASLPLRFNLSHSASGIAVLLSFDGTEVGADIEALHLPLHADRIARRSFFDVEYAAFSASDDRIGTFLRYWTAKEAVLKYTGEGFSRPMRTVIADLLGNRAAFAEAPADDVCRIFHYVTETSVICAATSHAAAPQLIPVPLSALRMNP